MYKYILLLLSAAFILGASAYARLITGSMNGAVTVGGTSVTSMTLQTDGTGDGELTIPGLSIDADETTFQMMETIVFCGQGGNSADRFLGPSTARGMEAVAGNAACDALDSDTAANADDIPWTNFQKGYTVNGMYCYVATGGTDDTITFTLYDDTVATDISCSIALDGSFKNCSDDEAEREDITSASKMAVMVDATAADEDLSDVDFHCSVFISH